MNLTQPQIMRTASQCLAELRELGYQPPIAVQYRVSSRLTRALGNCLEQRQMGKIIRLVITISADVPSETLKDVMMHELIHAVVGGREHHGYKFQALANLVNRTYGYRVGTYASTEEREAIQKVRAKKANFSTVRCIKCGNERVVSNRAGVVKYPHEYKCKCGGHLTVS